MRHCPSTAGSAPPPLITHRIGVDVCQARQGTFFHKCHRCIYRGQAADWEPEVAPVAPVDVPAVEETVAAVVKTVTIPQANGRKPANGKAPGPKPRTRGKRASVGGPVS